MFDGVRALVDATDVDQECHDNARSFQRSSVTAIVFWSGSVAGLLFPVWAADRPAAE
jgi:hypothetical protein